MLRITTVILMMCVGSWTYQTWLAETPNYMETFQMLYWAIVTTVVFWGAGLLNTRNK